MARVSVWSYGRVLMLCALGWWLPAAQAGTTLDDQKEAFAALMGERAGLAARARESQLTVTAGRRTTGRSGSANSKTALAYREAAIRVEKALDNHPRIAALQEQYDAAQAEKLEVSREQAKVADARREAREEQSRQLASALAEAGKRAGRERAALLKQAGVRDADKLPEGDQARFRDIHVRLTNEVASVRAAYTADTATDSAAAVTDDFALQFEALKGRYRDVEARQTELKAAMVRLRASLRRDDASVAKLQQAAIAASREHLVTMDAKPEATEARAFLRDVNAMRGAIDKRARALRKAILAEDLAYKPELDKQAAAGGLALVGDEFWQL